jgi:hypothetical protein
MSFHIDYGKEMEFSEKFGQGSLPRNLFCVVEVDKPTISVISSSGVPYKLTNNNGNIFHTFINIK